MVCWKSIQRTFQITKKRYYLKDLLHSVFTSSKFVSGQAKGRKTVLDFVFPFDLKKMNEALATKTEGSDDEKDAVHNNDEHFKDSGEEETNEKTQNKKPLSKHQLKLEKRKQQKQQQQSSISKKSLKRIQQQYLAITSQLSIFHNCYEAQYGNERWNNHLFPSLIQSTKHVALLNKYITDMSFAQQLLKINTGETLPYLSHFFDNIFIHRSDISSSIVSSGDVENAKAAETFPTNTTAFQANKETAEEITTYEADDGSKAPSTHRWPTPGISSSLDPSSGLCCYYPLDAASLFPVLLLDVKPQHRILDMCSAPGGKALTILQALNLHHFLPSSASAGRRMLTPSLGSLTCNDVSYDRKLRLQNVIRRYIPREISDLYSVSVTNFDLTNPTTVKQYFGGGGGNNNNNGSTNQEQSNNGRYDRILLDAPCSSERHLLQEFYHDFPFLAHRSSSSSSTMNDLEGDYEEGGENHLLFSKTQSIQLNQYELLQWSIGRNKSNAERQYQLLLNAIKLIQISGRIVYSTCSIHEIENDLLVQKALQKVNKYEEKNGYTIEVVPVESLLPAVLRSEAVTVATASGVAEALTLGEKTSCGWQILPDRSNGFGPIYLSVLTKKRYEPTSQKEKDGTTRPTEQA